VCRIECEQPLPTDMIELHDPIGESLTTVGARDIPPPLDHPPSLCPVLPFTHSPLGTMILIVLPVPLEGTLPVPPVVPSVLFVFRDSHKLDLRCDNRRSDRQVRLGLGLTVGLRTLASVRLIADVDEHFLTDDGGLGTRLTLRWEHVHEQ
jgi:hypothetical protein